jgi:hypothetical protein
MTLMMERSCAIVMVEEASYLCLPEIAEIPIPARAGNSPRTLKKPEENDYTIRVFAGSAHDDFRWTQVVPSYTPAPVSCAGIAAAVTALIFGLALRSERLLGSELSINRPNVYFPPCEGWWSGEWRVEMGEVQACHRAVLRMHGVLVLG